jgi:hypothetical protein
MDSWYGTCPESDFSGAEVIRSDVVRSAQLAAQKSADSVLQYVGNYAGAQAAPPMCQ